MNNNVSRCEEETFLEVIKIMLDKKVPIEDIAYLARMSVEEIEKIIEDKNLR